MSSAEPPSEAVGATNPATAAAAEPSQAPSTATPSGRPRALLLLAVCVVLHFGLLIVGAFALAAGHAGATSEARPSGGGLIVTAHVTNAVTLIVLTAVGGLLIARPRVPAWALFVPIAVPLVLGTVAVRVALRTASLAAATPPSEAAARAFTAAGGAAIDVLAAFGFATALALSATALFLSARSAGRAAHLKLGRTALITLGIGALGAASVAAALPAASAIVVLGPLAMGVGAIALAATALDGGLSSEQAQEVALDAALVSFAALGASAVGAVAFGSSVIGASLARGLSAGAASEGWFIAMDGWSEGVSLLRRAGSAMLPIVIAAVVILGGRAAFIGRAANVRRVDVVVAALVSLLSIALLRSELTHAGAAVAARWQPARYDDGQLAMVTARASLASHTDGARHVVSIGRTRIRQNSHDVGAAADLDADAGCTAVVGRLETGVRLVIAADAMTPYRRIACMLGAVAARGGGPERCKVVFFAEPRSPRAINALPPFDVARPFPIELASEVAGDGCDHTVDATALHLTTSGWRIEHPGAPPEQKEATISVLEQWVQSALSGKTVKLAADPEVPAANVLAVAAAITAEHGRVFLVVGPEPTSADASGQSKTSGTLRFEDPIMKGSINPIGVVAAVRARERELLDCYADALSRTPSLSGRLVVRFSVRLDGATTNVAPVTQKFRDSKMASCVATIFASTKFPTPNGGGGATLFFPLVFEPPEPEASEPTSSSSSGVRVQFGKVAVSGMIAPTEVQSRIEKLGDRLGQCADSPGNEKLDGVVALQFTIGPLGNVTNLRADPTTTLPPEVVSCVYGSIYHIGFPQPTKGTVKVTAPIRITRGAP